MTFHICLYWLTKCVCVDAIRPLQHYISRVRAFSCLSGLNHYYTKQKIKCLVVDWDVEHQYKQNHLHYMRVWMGGLVFTIH